MKFEKINENKIRIILNLNDLKDKNIDFNDFISNPLDTRRSFFRNTRRSKRKNWF